MPFLAPDLGAYRTGPSGPSANRLLSHVNADMLLLADRGLQRRITHWRAASATGAQLFMALRRQPAVLPVVRLLPDGYLSVRPFTQTRSRAALARATLALRGDRIQSGRTEYRDGASAVPTRD